MKRTATLLLFFLQSCFLFSQSGKIFTTSNKVIECNTIQNKRFGVHYVSVSSTDGTSDYIPHSKIDRIEYDNGSIEYISGSPTKKNNKYRKDPKDFTYLNPNYVALNVGPAVPFPGLDYYSDYTMNAPGQTGTGVQVYADASYNPDNFAGFGLSGFVGYNYNPINSTYFTSTLQDQLPGNANNVNITTRGWSNIYFMGGANYYYMENDWRWMLDAKVLIGGMYSYHPGATATYDTSGISKSTKINSEDLFLCLGAQVTARYFISRKFSLKASLNYMQAYGDFKELTRTDYQDSKPVYNSSIQGPGTATIQWIGITIGIAYTLGK